MQDTNRRKLTDSHALPLLVGVFLLPPIGAKKVRGGGSRQTMDKNNYQEIVKNNSLNRRREQ